MESYEEIMKLKEKIIFTHREIREECEELIEATEHNHVRWEAADLLFFTLLMAKSKGVSFAEIVNDLRSRNSER